MCVRLSIGSDVHELSLVTILLLLYAQLGVSDNVAVFVGAFFAYLQTRKMNDLFFYLL